MKRSILILLITLVHLQFVKATGQSAELIIYEGDTLQMLTEPLEPFLQKNEPRKRYHPSLEYGCSTALWRGYVGLWRIENGELILIDVFLCGEMSKSIRSKIFPDRDRIVASWFSGELSIQYGKLIKYNHSGYDRYYEEETVVTIEKGLQTSQQHFTNGTRSNDPGFTIKPDSILSEIYRRIKWDNLTRLSKDKKLYVELKMGEIDSLSIKGKLDGQYRAELKKALDDFPKLKKFYWRGKPLETAYVFTIVFSRASRKKYAR